MTTIDLNDTVPRMPEADILALSARIKAGDFSSDYILRRVIDDQKMALVWLTNGSLTEHGKETALRLIGRARSYELALSHSGRDNIK